LTRRYYITKDVKEKSKNFKPGMEKQLKEQVFLEFVVVADFCLLN